MTEHPAGDGLSPQRTIQWGDQLVPIIERSWPIVRIDGYRQTYRLEPGDSWRDAPVTAGQYEHVADVDGDVIPVGVAIVRDLLAGGVDWAYCTELWGTRPVLLDRDAMCVGPCDGAARFLELVRKVNGGRFGGLPDVIGQRDDTVFVREAKVSRGRDALRPNQHALVTALHATLGDRLDAAVVEWDVTVT